MTMLKQKEAVYQAITSVLGHTIESKVELSKEQKANVHTILVQSFLANKVELSKAMDEKQIKEYVPGLVSNWLRKDSRLNGDTKYAPKNPGSRAGQGDVQVREMRKLLSTLTDPAQRAEVQQFIASRLAEIAASKAKAVQVDFSALPAELRSRYSA